MTAATEKPAAKAQPSAPSPAGPPAVERRVSRPGRRSTDAVKMSCPFCGGSDSEVVRSRAAITDDAVRRRRECYSCGKRFPTSEHVDRRLLEREVGTAIFKDLNTTRLDQATPPVSWDDAEVLFYRLWGQAKDAAYGKSDWIAFQRMFDRLKRVG